MIMISRLAVLDIHNASLMLQSGRKSKHLDIIFVSNLSFIFVFMLTLLNINVLKETWLKTGHLFGPS